MSFQLRREELLSGEQLQSMLAENPARAAQAILMAAKQGILYDNCAPQIVEVCHKEFSKAMETLAQRLGDKPYVMGDTFTVPDLILGHCGGWAAMSKFPIPKDGLLYDYFKRLRERPAYIAMGKRVAEALK